MKSIKKGHIAERWLVLAGVFGTFLLFGLVTTFIYSPVVITNASDHLNTRVNAIVNPVVSLTLNTNHLVLSINAPTVEGTFDSSPIIATVSTNSTGGYELYFSSIDNSTDMVSADSTNSGVIASDFSGTVTGSTMGKDKWGYSLDDTNYKKIPTLSAQATIRNVGHYPTTSEKTNTVYIGAKVSSSLMAGSYSKSIVFTAVAHDTPEPTPTMQDFDKSTLATGESVELRDTRNDATYTVKKLADGNVWMTKNLSLDNVTLSSIDSNIPDGETFEIPTSTSTDNQDDREQVHVANGAYGGFYSFYTATAGWGTEDVSEGNASQDICPKGWRLPTGGNGGEYETLYNAYGSLGTMMDEPGFVLAGYIFQNNANFQDYFGAYWTSTVFDKDDAYYFNLAENEDPTDYIDKLYKHPIRCIAK